MNDDFWESRHPNSPLFTPIQQIPQSPAPTIQTGSEETHPTSSVHEEIPATSAEETAAAESLKTQTATKEEPEIPQPEEPEIAIPEVVMQLTDTPVPKPTDPFSKKQKFKAEDFFSEHVSSQITTPMTLLALGRGVSGLPARQIFIPQCCSTKTKSSIMSTFLTWTWNLCLASCRFSVCFTMQAC